MQKIEIILFSDNHGDRRAVQYLRDTYPSTDIFVSCGDSEMSPDDMYGIISVQGNNDYYRSYPDHRILEIGGHRIYVCHGHHDMIYGHFEMLSRTAEQNDCDMVFFGHTHVYFDQTIDGIRILNPGSIWRNRDGSDPSYMVITMDDAGVHVERKDY